MKKLILFVLCALSGLMVSAQSRWGITPEGGFAAVNRVGMGSSWRAGVKVGVGVSYQFEPGWIGLNPVYIMRIEGIRWEIIRERRSLPRMS